MTRNKEQYNAYMREYMLKRYEKRRLAGIEQLGGKCVLCSSTTNLHFHHKDPLTKSFTLGKGSSYSEKRWQDELAKCELLCKDCHETEHESKAPCGTVQRYWRGCRCSDCKQAASEYNKERAPLRQR